MFTNYNAKNVKPCGCQSCRCVSTHWVCGFCGEANPSDTLICPCRYEEQDWWHKTSNAPEVFRSTYITSVFHE